MPKEVVVVDPESYSWDEKLKKMSPEMQEAYGKMYTEEMSRANEVPARKLDDKGLE